MDANHRRLCPCAACNATEADDALCNETLVRSYLPPPPEPEPEPPLQLSAECENASATAGERILYYTALGLIYQSRGMYINLISCGTSAVCCVYIHAGD